MPDNDPFSTKHSTPRTRRGMIVEAEERMSASGETLVPLSDAETNAVCRKVAALKPEAIAVCFLHSYVDPTHEQIMGRALRRARARHRGPAVRPPR